MIIGASTQIPIINEPINEEKLQERRVEFLHQLKLSVNNNNIRDCKESCNPAKFPFELVFSWVAKTFYFILYFLSLSAKFNYFNVK